MRCNGCKARFSETRNTILHHYHYPADTIRRIIICSAEGNGGEDHRQNPGAEQGWGEQDHPQCRSALPGGAIQPAALPAHGVAPASRAMGLRPEKTLSEEDLERSNATQRLNHAHLHGKTCKFNKDMDYLKAKLAIGVLFHSFIRPHLSLSRNTDKTFTTRTPAIKAGLVDRSWTTKFAFERPEIIYFN